MARTIDAKCRKCRRAMEKLFLKGDRCASAKCAVVRRNYAPGVHGSKSKRNISEYGAQLAGKQKIKRIYGILEKQFRKHFNDVRHHKEGMVGDLFLMRLEKRLDNVVYRMGLAPSRSHARQLVTHGLINVNGKKMNIASSEVKIGDVIAVADRAKGKNYFKNLTQIMKNKKDFPSWISFNADTLEGKLLHQPEKDEIGINLDMKSVIEYYSR